MVKNNTLVALALVALASTSATQALTLVGYVPSAGSLPGYALKGLGLTLVASTAYVALRSAVPVNEIKRASKDASFLAKTKDVFMNDFLGTPEKELGLIQREFVDEDGNKTIVLDKNFIPATGLVGKLLSKSKRITQAFGIAAVTTMALVAAGVLSEDLVKKMLNVQGTVKLVVS